MDIGDFTFAWLQYVSDVSNEPNSKNLRKMCTWQPVGAFKESFLNIGAGVTDNSLASLYRLY